MRRKWQRPSRQQRKFFSRDYDILDGGRQWKKLRKFLQRSTRAADDYFKRGGFTLTGQRVDRAVYTDGNEGRIHSYEAGVSGGQNLQAVEENTESSGG